MMQEQNPKRWRDTLVHDDPSIEAATRLVRRFDPETISFQAKKNVWSRLHDYPHSQAKWSMPKIGMAITLCLGIAGLVASGFFSSPPAKTAPPMKFLAVKGVVYSNPNRGDDHRVLAGDHFDDSTIIRTALESTSSITIPNVGTLHIDSNSEVSIRRHDKALKIALFRGRISANISPDPDRLPVTVSAGAWTIAVVGTVFEVTRSSGDEISVYVSKGEVEVRGPNQSLRLKSKERFQTKPLADGLAATSNTDNTRPDSQDQIESSPRLKAAAQKRSQAAIKAEMLVKLPLQALPKRSAAAQENRQAKKQARAKPPTKRTKKTPRKKHRAKKRASLAPAQTIKKVPAPLTPRPPLQAKRQEAMRAMTLPPVQLNDSQVPNDLLQYQSAAQEPNPAQAMMMFDSVAESDSSHAEVAAHRAAKLALEQEDDEEALRRYLVIRDKFPRGLHAKATTTGLITLRLKQCQLHEGRGDLNRFIKDNPSFRDSKDLAFLSGELYRRTKKYEKAIKAFTHALGSQYDEDAMYLRAWCMLAIDPSSEEAKKIITEYQTQYPQGRYISEIQRVLRDEESLIDPSP